MSDNIEQVGVGQIATSEQQRIIFVEPNDVYDKDADNAHQGLSLTPKYEDFCISFNLIIEAFSRFKTLRMVIRTLSVEEEKSSFI